MKILLKLEDLGLMLLGVYLALTINPNFIILVIAFFVPDISIAAYLINTKIGSYIYNVFHHRGLAAILIVLGYILSQNVLIYIGAVFLAHSSFDRILGFGLKYADDFKHTHLGRLK